MSILDTAFALSDQELLARTEALAGAERETAAMCRIQSNERSGGGTADSAHHIHPWALDGPSTPEILSLRCPRHNAYEAEAVFGARRRPRPAETIGP